MALLLWAYLVTIYFNQITMMQLNFLKIKYFIIQVNKIYNKTNRIIINLIDDQIEPFFFLIFQPRHSIRYFLLYFAQYMEPSDYPNVLR